MDSEAHWIFIAFNVLLCRDPRDSLQSPIPLEHSSVRLMLQGTFYVPPVLTWKGSLYMSWFSAWSQWLQYPDWNQDVIQAGLWLGGTLLWQKIRDGWGVLHELPHVSAGWDHVMAVAATDASPGMLIYGCASEPWTRRHLQVLRWPEDSQCHHHQFKPWRDAGGCS